MTFNSLILNAINNRVVMSCVVTFLLAKLLKAVIMTYRGKERTWRLFFTAGGMPSVHTATVAALASSFFLQEGVTSLSFAILVFSLIIIHDAMSVRWLVGQQSVMLNKIMTTLRKEGKLSPRKMEEIMGHTPAQVIGGIVLGLFVSVIVYGVM